MFWSMPVLPEVGRWGKKNHEVEASLSYMILVPGRQGERIIEER